jgi:hypothetical protein
VIRGFLLGAVVMLLLGAGVLKYLTSTPCMSIGGNFQECFGAPVAGCYSAHGRGTGLVGVILQLTGTPVARDPAG